MSNRFYLTTPIYYPNGEPHLGHAYTTLCADVIARYHRLAGEETFFLTGTDEHGVKMVKTAAEKGISPRQLADLNVAVFENLWKEFHVTHDDFIRTSSDRHKVGVQAIVKKMIDNGDIYLGAYQGWYDEGQEEFVTETEAKAAEYKSTISGRPLVRYSEPTYFFSLKKYIPRVLAHIQQNPDFIQPEARRNEVLSKLNQGVEDLSISRATLKWGIPMPHDPDHVLYVWIDALSNYITALGYGQADDSLFKKFWPADLHLIGKEIMWFHVVYWPAMLFSLGIDPPRQVFAHGWWTAEGKKMSKSLGNFIDIDRLRKSIAIFGLDGLRYYLLRAAPFGNDLDWKDEEMAGAYKELGDVVGNCLNRIMTMVPKYRGALPAMGEVQEIDRTLMERTRKLPGDLAGAYQRLELQQCALLPVELARATNGYIEATAPFKMQKDPAQASRLDTVLHVTTQAVYSYLVALLPILPEKAAAGLAQMNIQVGGKSLAELFAASPAPGHTLGTGSPLFPRIETK